MSPRQTLNIATRRDKATTVKKSQNARRAMNRLRPLVMLELTLPCNMRDSWRHCRALVAGNLELTYILEERG